ncbi:MAG: methionyl-tRNA formyltransferase [Clostridia bacterium]|nr:methionyl-tRNA formyltransferase [Clostridia bacterium]
MNIVFMGTPDFAANSLKALIDAGHKISAVFTQPDKPVGRKQILTAPPVKELALDNGLPVYQPNTLKDGEAEKLIKDIAPDICVVVAYGKLIPASMLNIAKHGCINVHASLLPKYRGASPIQWSIVCGEKVTGVSTMLLDEGMDTGDILLTSSTEIADTDTASTLWDRLSNMGADLLLKTLDGLENGSITPIKQDEALATYAPIIKKEDALIDWTKSANEINCLIRGLQTWPTAYTFVNDKRLKIFEAKVLNGIKGECGEILKQDTELVVACGNESALMITDLQLEGSKRMAAADMLRGRKLGINKF